MAPELSESTEEGGRGALVVVEGLDRAGKSCQCELLVRKLREMGHQVRYVRFPGSFTIVLSRRRVRTLVQN